jgi:hypothetical protein
MWRAGRREWAEAWSKGRRSTWKRTVAGGFYRGAV